MADFSELVQQQREDDGSGKAEDDLQQADDDRVAQHAAEIGIEKQVSEVLEIIPRAAQDAEPDSEVLEGDDHPPDREVVEDEQGGCGNQAEDIEDEVLPGLPPAFLPSGSAEVYLNGRCTDLCHGVLPKCCAHSIRRSSHESRSSRPPYARSRSLTRLRPSRQRVGTPERRSAGRRKFGARARRGPPRGGRSCGAWTMTPRPERWGQRQPGIRKSSQLSRLITVAVAFGWVSTPFSSW